MARRRTLISEEGHGIFEVRFGVRNSRVGDERVSHEDDLISGWVEQLRFRYPDAVAILLKGSYARDDAGAFSDIDFDVLLDGAPFERYSMYLVESVAGNLRHVSIAVESLVSWLDSEREAVDWAFGLAVRVATKLLWARTPDTALLLDRDCREHPSAEPELEDFVESIGKIENAIANSDDLAVRLAAQTVAKLAPGLLQVLNPVVFPGTVRQALDAALGFRVAPVEYREDMLHCLGLSGEAVSTTSIAESAHRLVLGVLEILQERADNIQSGEDGDPFTLLRNGTLLRYVREMRRDRENTYRSPSG